MPAAPVAALAALLVFCMTGQALGANQGRYLPSPLGLNNISDIAYGNSNAGGPWEFDQTVTCQAQGTSDCGKAGDVIGQIHFTYDTWTGTYKKGTAQQEPTGGGALAGGFYASPNGPPECAGFQWGWVQIVRSTYSGSNEWGANDSPTNHPNTTWFPDTAGTINGTGAVNGMGGTPRTNPDYPFEFLPGGLNPAPAPPTLGFQDFPNRFPNDAKPQTWLAELGLVCKNMTTHVMHVIETFFWGFGIDNAGNFTETHPQVWGAPTATYIATLQNAFNGAGGANHSPMNNNWTIDVGCCDPVPEPASMIYVFAAGMVFFGRRYYRRRCAA